MKTIFRSRSVKKTSPWCGAGGRNLRAETSGPASLPAVKPSRWQQCKASRLERRDGPSLVQGVERKPAEQLGVEVGRLLRHDLATQGDLLHLLQRDRLDEKGNVGLAASDLRGCVFG